MHQETIVAQPVIETDRLTLRPLRKSDAGVLELVGSDVRVASMTRTIPHPLPPGATEAFISTALSADRREDIWAMDGTKSGRSEVMGVIALERMDRNQSEVGYWVAPAFWRTGLASEAVAALVEANPHDDATMFASVFQDNPVSARVLTNLGFAYLGDAEAYSVARGATVPTWTYLKKLK